MRDSLLFATVGSGVIYGTDYLLGWLGAPGTCAVLLLVALFMLLGFCSLLREDKR